jgi:hypothetical protein
MFGNDVLDRFNERRRFQRRIIDSLTAVLNICLLSGIAAFVVLTIGGRTSNFESHTAKMSTSSPPASAPRPQKGARSAETKPEIAPTVRDEAASFVPQDNILTPALPLPQFDPTIAAVPLRPETTAPSQESVANVPIPVARRNRKTIGQAQKSATSNAPTNKPKNDFAKRDGPAQQTKEAKRQSNAGAHEPKTPDVEDRRITALDLERSYMSAGISISTKLSGLNGTVLNIQYPQFNDEMVQKIMGVKSFTATLGKVGFTKIVFTGAQDQTWAFPLQPPAQANTASQAPASNKANP